MARLSVQEAVPSPGDSADRHRRVSSAIRRAQILGVARKVFAASGFRGTTTKQIAVAAGVTEALLFQHFATKQDLYNSILEAKAGENPIEPVLAALRSHAERRDDRAFLEEYARCSLARYRTDSEFLRLMLYSALEGHELALAFRRDQVKPIQTELRRYIAARQREGAFRKLRVTAAVRAFAGAIGNYALVKGIFGPAEAGLSEKQAIREFTDLFLHGVNGNGA
ncbi:MAG: TetR/AcrR family transcriptional regulator [Bryobacteraceae bacterium]